MAAEFAAVLAAPNWVTEAIPKTSIPLDKFRLSSLPQGHDHPGEARLLGGHCGGQDSAYRAEATVQTKLAQ